MVYLCHSNPIVLFHMDLNTCYPSVFFSTGCKCDFPFVNARMTSLACFQPTLSAENGRSDTNSNIKIAQKCRSPQVWQVKYAREQGKHFGWILLVLYAMFVKLFTTQLNKLVSKRLCINSVYDDLTLIRHDYVYWSPSRLTAETQRFLLFVVVSSNSSHWFFLQMMDNNDAKNHIYISSSWFWLRLRDTKMAGSNRCQAAGHMGENEE